MTATRHNPERKAAVKPYSCPGTSSADSLPSTNGTERPLGSSGIGRRFSGIEGCADQPAPPLLRDGTPPIRVELPERPPSIPSAHRVHQRTLLDAHPVLPRVRSLAVVRRRLRPGGAPSDTGGPQRLAFIPRRPEG